MQNYVGKQIERYRITERLGMGGMAVVYKAYDTRLERDVALKLIRTGAIPPEQTERLLKRFEREAKSQARFDHKHIVTVFDYGDVDGSPYLVMAFIPGGTLKDRLHDPVDWQQAVRWLIPVAEALSYAHQRGIIHRDVKPANILFDEEDQPILTDFGIAKVLETDEATLTGTGLGVGTPEYMAPEQWQGKTSAASDQYALGVVLYELITGRKPYSADTPAAIILMQATEPLQAPSGLVKGVPDAVEKVLYKTLARNPEDRFENMDAFAKALRGLLATAETEEPVLPKPTTQPKEPPSAVKEAVYSEGVTHNALDATPAEELPLPPTNGKQEKKGLPKWALWAGGGIIGLVLITLAFNLGSKSANTPKADNAQVASIAIEAEVATTAPTETTVPTKTATIIPTPEPTLGIGSTMINKVDGSKLAFIPAGYFTMGITDDQRNYILGLNWCDTYRRYYNNGTNYWTLPECDINDQLFTEAMPAHEVFVNDFWMQVTEVTSTQYRSCIISGSCSGSINNFPETNTPATYVDWFQANEYCNWIGGRLPTEAEWEKAAKGPENNLYTWGGDTFLENHGNLSGTLVEVGSFPSGASPYGIMDMAGNAWEWIADYYSDDYYSGSEDNNPSGPFTGTSRVVRGGYHFGYRDPIFIMVFTRSYRDPERGFSWSGIRCVVDN
jgi:serine/threonine protein kinase